MNKTVPYRKAIYANSGLKTDNIKYQTIESGKQALKAMHHRVNIRHTFRYNKEIDYFKVKCDRII